MSRTAELMNRINAKLQANPQVASNFNAKYRFVLEGEDGGTWLANLKDAPGVTAGDGAGDCTLTLSAADFVAMLEGRADGQALFFQGKLKIEGDMGLALKLQHLAALAR